MSEAHGDEFAADASADFFAAVRRLLPSYQAEEIKCIGDAVMVRVPEAGRAVDLAVHLVGELGASHGALALRVGLHSGPAVERDGDWYGAAVNLAARVAAAADRGEVLMTEARHLSASSMVSQFRVQHRAAQRFKNVIGRVSLYAIVLAAQPGASSLPIDPVCRMAVDPSVSTERRTYGGDELHFCSTTCALVFDRHPGRYPPVASGGP